jgi:uncharacterized HAD superfamily protein
MERGLRPVDNKTRVAVDLDGTLTKKGLFPDIWELTPKELWKIYEEVEPDNDMIEKVNQLYSAGNLIYIFTARTNLHQRITKKWLDKHKVKYHYILMDKPYYDIIIDDKAFRPEEVKNGKGICY